MNLQELSNLSESQLNELLINYDMWEYNKLTNQLSKKCKHTTLTFPLNDFAPFSKPKQAEVILESSYLDFSGIQQNYNNKWGLMVFPDKHKKYLILESDSKMKSSLLLLLSVRMGLLQP